GSPPPAGHCGSLSRRASSPANGALAAYSKAEGANDPPATTHSPDNSKKRRRTPAPHVTRSSEFTGPNVSNVPLLPRPRPHEVGVRSGSGDGAGRTAASQVSGAAAVVQALIRVVGGNGRYVDHVRVEMGRWGRYQ
ncbi:MAG TPA: hypothetical protein VHY21_22880, partial [Pseudonocardiaceae bacterium]|nr:hypothetical protein [Pseudonocardiaceae bacterium]